MNIKRSRLYLLLLLGVVIALPACGGNSNRKPTYKVKGRVLVDGKPANEVFVNFHPADEEKRKQIVAYGQANENGDFEVNTYVAKDGIPEGDFAVCIEWPERSGIAKNNFEGPDRLKKKYSDPNKPFKTVHVDKTGLDMGTIELPKP